MFEVEFDEPGPGVRLATLVLNREDEKHNLLRPEDLHRAESAVETIEGEPEIGAIVVRSAKPGSFLAGVDVETFAQMPDRRDIEAFVRRGQALFERLARSSRPIVAAIEGVCTGAGLELTLACDARICADSPDTELGLPEIQLGLFPAGGALARLPRIVGLESTLELVLKGRKLHPGEAQRMRLVDEVVRSEALVQAARDTARRLVAGVSRRSAAGSLRALQRHNPFARRAVLRRARATLRQRNFGLDPAPLAALDVLERGAGRSIEEALALEPPAFAELAVGEVARARVSLFLSSKALRHARVRDRSGASVEPAPLEALGILGGGVMGADVGVAAAGVGLSVRIREKGPEPLGRALGRVRRQFDRRAERRGEGPVFRERARVSGGLEFRGFETMDLVLEAVPEDLALKQRVFAELERKVRPDTVLATHTRALPIAEVGARVKRRDRLVGMHFFRPVARMPLCEIVRTDDTSDRTLATCIAFSRRLGKTPIVVRDSPGFFATRVLTFYLLGALEMFADGHSIEDIDGGARRVGWPIGPLALIDALGVDVGVRVSRIMATAYPKRAHIVESLEAMANAKRLGRWNGRGFYLHTTGAEPKPDPQLRSWLGLQESRRSTDPEELGDRLTIVAALEAVRCLQEGIISSPRDGDVAAVLGLGYPRHRGGPFRHLAARGLSSIRSRLAALEDRFGPRFEAPRLLTELAGAGRDFESLEATA